MTRIERGQRDVLVDIETGSRSFIGNDETIVAYLFEQGLVENAAFIQKESSFSRRLKLTLAGTAELDRLRAIAAEWAKRDRFEAVSQSAPGEPWTHWGWFDSEEEMNAFLRRNGFAPTSKTEDGSNIWSVP